MPNQLDKLLDTPATIEILLGIAGTFLLYRVVCWLVYKFWKWYDTDVKF